MSQTYSPKRFTNIGLLRKLDFPLLIRLLETYKDFFEAQPGFQWAHDPAEFSYSSLVHIMLRLNTSAPEKLLETLYFAEFFADRDFFDRLLYLADTNGIDVPHNMAPPDLAILLCLECRHESRSLRGRGERFIQSPGVYRGSAPPGDYPPPPPKDARSGQSACGLPQQ